MTNKEALAHLKELSLNLNKVEYNDIMELLKESIAKIPFPIARLKPATLIDRARKNDGDVLFTHVDQLNYIKDQDVIDQYLIEFGRANKPHQAMFYGAVESTRINTQRITAIAETSSLFQDRNGVSFEGELFTVSRWKNSSELFLAEMVFAEKAIEINPDINKAYHKQLEFAHNAGGDVDFYSDFLIFISEQFARPKSTHHDYKISTAYTELALGINDISGVAFPSVQTNYWGQNIVLSPTAVDKFLTIQVLATQRLFKNKMRTLLTNHKNCLNPTECYDNIQWVDLDAQYLTSLKDAQQFLNEVD